MKNKILKYCLLAFLASFGNGILLYFFEFDNPIILIGFVSTFIGYLFGVKDVYGIEKEIKSKKDGR